MKKLVGMLRQFINMQLNSLLGHFFKYRYSNRPADVKMPALLGETMAERLELESGDIVDLVKSNNLRIYNLESQLGKALHLLELADQRAQSILYQSQQMQCAVDFLLSMNHREYIETQLNGQFGFGVGKKRENMEEFVLKTCFPIASASHDHIYPESTTEGIVRPYDFVSHCIDLLGNEFSVLDLGCGGGGLVFEFLSNQIFAIGLDGSDHCRRYKQGYWPILVQNLLTCDISESFIFERSASDYKFDLITAWEVLEHIPEDRIDRVLGNVKLNLSADGCFIGSISMVEYNAENGNPYHVTLRSKEWWVTKFRESGFYWYENSKFNLKYFPRGNGVKFQDYHNYHKDPAAGFHFVVKAFD